MCEGATNTSNYRRNTGAHEYVVGLRPGVRVRGLVTGDCGKSLVPNLCVSLKLGCVAYLLLGRSVTICALDI